MAEQCTGLGEPHWAGDGAVTATPSESGCLDGFRDMDGDTPANRWRGISWKTAEVAALAGCVWSDDVKDQTRLPSKRHPWWISPLVKGVIEPSGRSPLERSWAHADVALIHGFERSKVALESRDAGGGGGRS